MKLFRFSYLNNVKKYHKVVKDTATKDEEMPDSMVVWFWVVDVVVNT